MKYLQLLFDNEITDLCNFSICAQVHLTKNAYTNMATINHSILLVVKSLSLLAKFVLQLCYLVTYLLSID